MKFSHIPQIQVITTGLSILNIIKKTIKNIKVVASLAFLIIELGISNAIFNTCSIITTLLSSEYIDMSRDAYRHILLK